MEGKRIDRRINSIKRNSSSSSCSRIVVVVITVYVCNNQQSALIVLLLLLFDIQLPEFASILIQLSVLPPVDFLSLVGDCFCEGLIVWAVALGSCWCGWFERSFKEPGRLMMPLKPLRELFRGALAPPRRKLSTREMPLLWPCFESSRFMTNEPLPPASSNIGLSSPPPSS